MWKKYSNTSKYFILDGLKIYFRRFKVCFQTVQKSILIRPDNNNFKK